MAQNTLTPYLSPNIMIGNIICSFLSLFGSIFIIVFFIIIKQIRSLIHSLIFCIAISETINSIAHLLSIVAYRTEDSNLLTQYNYVCYIQTTLIHLTDTSTMVFLCIICYCIVSLIIYNNKKLFLKKQLFYLLGTIIPVCFSGIILTLFYTFVSNKILGNTSIKQDLYLSWCWLKVKKVMNNNKEPHEPSCLSEDYPVIITLVVYWLMIAFIVFSIVKVIIFIKKKQNISGGTALYIKIQNVISQLYNYPLVGCLCWLFTTLTVVFPFYSKEKSVTEERGNYGLGERIQFLFLSMNGIFTSLRGFFIFIIFISGEKVYKIVSEKFDKMASSFKTNATLNVNADDNSESNTLEKTVLNEKLVFE